MTAPNDVDVEGERAGFEAHYASEGVTQFRRDPLRNRYQLRWLNDAFNGWLAAKRDAEQEVKS